jgi:carbonic anhydrase
MLGAMAVVDQLLGANRDFVRGFADGGKPAAPARGIAVVTCMDARIDPARALGLEIGDAHVIRNAGGRVSDDAIRSLIISITMLDTREVVVIQHTDCGMQTFTNDDMHARLADERGADASHIDFLPFPDVEASVREDVERLRSDPHIGAGITVSGYVYDVATGALAEVVAPLTTA